MDNSQRLKINLLNSLDLAVEMGKLPKMSQVLKQPRKFIISRINHILNSFYRAANPHFCWEVSGKTFFGKDMKLCMPEIVSAEIYKKGYFEYGLSKLIIMYLEKDQVFVDIGAHFGFFTLLANELVGKGGELHAFEPTPSTYNILQQNVSSIKQLKVNQLAVFSSNQELMINDYGSYLSAYNSFTTLKMNSDYADNIGVKNIPYKVQAIKLDDYFSNKSRRPNFIKIDAESAEMEILKGMTGILSHDRPLITLEVGDINDSISSKSCVEFIKNFDYNPFEIDDEGRLMSHVAKDTYGWDNLLFAPSEKAMDLVG